MKTENVNGESLYPNTLFHFTSKTNLYGILSSSFKLSYSLETVVANKLKRTFGVPMVSFCDIKLSELSVHMKKYQKYGIGLKKDWANQKGLNPVLYVSKYSPFTQKFLDAMGEVYPLLARLKREYKKNPSKEYDYIQEKEIEKKHNAGRKRELNILNSYRYIKNYENDLIRKGKITKNYRFADEREWRYVPPIELPFKHEPFIAESNMRTISQKELLNKSLANERLEFSFNDIRYIILEQDKDIPECISHLKNLKLENNLLERLISCIITAERMSQDV